MKRVLLLLVSSFLLPQVFGMEIIVLSCQSHIERSISEQIVEISDGIVYVRITEFKDPRVLRTIQFSGLSTYEVSSGAQTVKDDIIYNDSSNEDSWLIWNLVKKSNDSVSVYINRNTGFIKIGYEQTNKDKKIGYVITGQCEKVDTTKKKF